MRRSRSWSRPPSQRPSGSRVSSTIGGSTRRGRRHAGLPRASRRSTRPPISGRHLARAVRRMDLPTFDCHVWKGRGRSNELVPLPGEGFGCDLTHDRRFGQGAAGSCQARVTAISGRARTSRASPIPDRTTATASPSGADGCARRVALCAFRARAIMPPSGESALDLPLRAAPGAPAHGRPSSCRSSAARDPDLEVDARRRTAAPSRRPGLTGWPTTSSSFSARRCRHAEASSTCKRRYLPPAEQGSVVRRCGSIGRARSF